MQNNLPERGTLLPVDDYGHGGLPKRAERVYGKPAKTDLVEHYIDARSGEVKDHHLPAARDEEGPGKPTDGTKTTTDAAAGGDDDDAPDRRGPGQT